MGLKNIALATRKGLLVVAIEDGAARVVHEAFPGAHVAIAFLDPRTNNLFACISDGHFWH